MIFFLFFSHSTGHAAIIESASPVVSTIAQNVTQTVNSSGIIAIGINESVLQQLPFLSSNSWFWYVNIVTISWLSWRFFRRKFNVDYISYGNDPKFFKIQGKDLYYNTGSIEKPKYDILKRDII